MPLYLVNPFLCAVDRLFYVYKTLVVIHFDIVSGNLPDGMIKTLFLILKRASK